MAHRSAHPSSPTLHCDTLHGNGYCCTALNILVSVLAVCDSSTLLVHFVPHLAFPVVPHEADVAQICKHFRQLEGPVSCDIDAVIAAINNDESARSARDFKSRVDSVALTYEPLIKKIIAITKSDAGRFSTLALRDAAKAEIHANMLYSWARTFIPKDPKADMHKAAKLKMMPYVVAMAYAVRVKLDVHYVESSEVSKAERLEYLERSRNIVEQFTEVLEVVIKATLNDSSLIEVALDYHLTLSTYVALMIALRTSAQLALAPGSAPETTALWDDGLSQIR